MILIDPVQIILIGNFILSNYKAIFIDEKNNILNIYISTNNILTAEKLALEKFNKNYPDYNYNLLFVEFVPEDYNF